MVSSADLYRFVRLHPILHVHDFRPIVGNRSELPVWNSFLALYLTGGDLRTIETVVRPGGAAIQGCVPGGYYAFGLGSGGDRVAR